LSGDTKSEKTEKHFTRKFVVAFIFVLAAPNPGNPLTTLTRKDDLRIF